MVELQIPFAIAPIRLERNIFPYIILNANDNESVRTYISI